MVKINEQFSAKPYNRGWELHHSTQSTSEKSKTGIKTDITFYATFALLGKAVLDKSVTGISEIRSAINVIDIAEGNLIAAIKKNNIKV